MSGCAVCSGGTPPPMTGAEFFTEYQAPMPTQPGCPLKGQSCIYNAQGELVCGGQSQLQLPTPSLDAAVSSTKTPLFEGFQERPRR